MPTKKILLGTLVSLIIHHHATLADAYSIISSAVYSSRSTKSSASPVRSTVTSLYSSHDNLFGEDNSGFFDAEAIKRELEELIVAGGAFERHIPDEAGASSASSPCHRPAAIIKPASIYEPEIRALPETPCLDVNLPPRPPLTTIERERRSTEITLLAYLSEGDDVESDLRNLWISERGPKAAGLLRQADDLINDGKEGWDEAEQILRSLIETHGVYFTEPVNRLATLYLLQGKLAESLTLNQIVLAIKPWHIGALSHIVMVYAALGDHFLARQWAAFRLPTASMVRRRNRWVEKAVVDATSMLHQSEENLTSSFGEPDREWLQTKMNGDPWQ